MGASPSRRDGEGDVADIPFNGKHPRDTSYRAASRAASPAGHRGRDVRASTFQYREDEHAARPSVGMWQSMLLRSEAEKGKTITGNILVLGTQSSGKTTIVQQIQELLANFVEEKTRTGHVHRQIQQQILGDMRRLTLMAAENGFAWADAEHRQLADTVMQGQLTTMRLHELGKLWSNSNFREFYFSRTHSGTFPEDNAHYFFDRIDEFTAEGGYVPTAEDLVRLRQVPPVKDIPQQWRMRIPDSHEPSLAHRMTVVDVCGSMEGRRLWHRCFNNTVMLIYVVALSDYSHIDMATGANGMSEAFSTFRSLMNSSWFGECDILLVFTKFDVFREKIEFDSIGNYFTDAPQGERGLSMHAALKYIVERFQHVALHSGKRRVMHPCVLDLTSDFRKSNVPSAVVLRRIRACLCLRSQGVDVEKAWSEKPASAGWSSYTKRASTESRRKREKEKQADSANEDAASVPTRPSLSRRSKSAPIHAHEDGKAS